MAAITGIGIALLLLICVPKILSFYDISLSSYGPYLSFLIFIIILTFILPHDFNTTINDNTVIKSQNYTIESDVTNA